MSRILRGTGIAFVVLVLILVPIRGHAAPILRPGDTGQAVLTLQQMLSQAGFPPGPVDGYFGPRTLAALKSFQSTYGLVADGICGPLTWAALERALEVSRNSGRLRGITIALDAGHGGKEPGAISPWGDKEKDFTLPITLKIRDYLERYGARVILTRYGDYSPGWDWWQPVDELLARVSLANSNAADVFVSIHCNAYPKDPTVSGVMAFYRAGSAESVRLARNLAGTVARTSGLELLGVQEGPYYVLNHTYMPAVLMELGFMTNWHDVTLLRQNWFQDVLAQGIVQGILSYFGR